MKGQNWHNPAEDAVTPPDALPSTNDAIANLNDNAQSLKEFEQWAEVENRRIAEMLDIAAAAYQKVDDDYGKAHRECRTHRGGRGHHHSRSADAAARNSRSPRRSAAARRGRIQQREPDAGRADRT